MRYLDIAASGSKGVCTWAHVIRWEGQSIAVATNSDKTVVHMSWGRQYDTLEQFPLLAMSSEWKAIEWEARRLKDELTKMLREYSRYSYYEAAVRRDALEKLLQRNPGETILRFVQGYLVVGMVQSSESALLEAKTTPLNKEVVFVTDSRRILNAMPDNDLVDLYATPQKPIMMIGEWGRQMAILSATKTQPKRTVFTNWLEAVAN